MNTPVIRGKVAPVDAATLAAYAEKRAAAAAAAAPAGRPASERKRASMPGEATPRAPDPYVYGHLVTNNGIVSAQMRRSTFEALAEVALASRLNDANRAPRSQGLPAYVAPGAATRSQNYDRTTLWQSVKSDRAYFSRG